MQLKRGCKGWWIALLVAAADRVTKAVVHRWWDRPRLLDRTFDPLIPGVVNIKMATNRGVAFSMLSGQTVLLTVLALVVIALVAGWLVAHPDEHRYVRAGLWMVVGGGLGNLYDRLAYGYVIDFIDLAFVRFAVFNVADVCICLGAALVIAGAFIEEREKKERTHGQV